MRRSARLQSSTYPTNSINSTNSSSTISSSKERHSNMPAVTNEQLLERIDSINSSITATVQDAVANAVTEALLQSNARIAELESKLLDYDRRFEDMQSAINLLQTESKRRIFKLEHNYEELATESERQQQRSRRMNVRIENIAFDSDQDPKKETDSQLLAKIIEECAKADITITAHDIVRHHRCSKPSLRDGVLQAQTIVKLARWDTRKLFQSANKRAREQKQKFSCSNDLTKPRHNLLKAARDRIQSSLAQKYPEFDVKKDNRKIPDKENCFTFSTPDGQLMMRCAGHMFGYSSRDEFEQLFRENFSVTRSV